MRKVALDLGARKTAYCEVAEGAVIQRATVTAVETLNGGVVRLHSGDAEFGDRKRLELLGYFGEI